MRADSDKLALFTPNIFKRKKKIQHKKFDIKTGTKYTTKWIVDEIQNSNKKKNDWEWDLIPISTFSYSSTSTIATRRLIVEDLGQICTHMRASTVDGDKEIRNWASIQLEVLKANSEAL